MVDENEPIQPQHIRFEGFIREGAAGLLAQRLLSITKDNSDCVEREVYFFNLLCNPKNQYVFARPLDSVHNNEIELFSPGFLVMVNLRKTVRNVQISF